MLTADYTYNPDDLVHTVTYGNGIVDIVDLVIVLDGFMGLFRFPGITFEDIDIFPCDGGNGDINLMDIFAILDALAGFPPCPCP